MRSYRFIQVYPKHNGKYPYKTQIEKRSPSQRCRGESYVKTQRVRPCEEETEAEDMHHKTNKHLKPLEAERGKKGFRLEHLEGM